MKIFNKIWAFYLELELEIFTNSVVEMTNSQLYIFKNFSKRIYLKKNLFDYLYTIKYIINLIILSCLRIIDIFNDFFKFSFRSGIFKQSYFYMYIRFKKRNASWYNLIYF